MDGFAVFQKDDAQDFAGRGDPGPFARAPVCLHLGLLWMIDHLANPLVANRSPVGPPAHVAKVVPPGDVPELQQALETAYRNCARGEINFAAIRAFAETRTWPMFRAQVADWARQIGPTADQPSHLPA